MYSNDFNKEHYEKCYSATKPFTLDDGSKIETFKTILRRAIWW